MSAHPAMLDQLVKQAEELIGKDDFVFSDFLGMFSGFNKTKACELLNGILGSILEQAVENGKPAYSDQVHLAALGDFNLTLNTIGGCAFTGETLCASEFDMILVNIGEQAVSVPIYYLQLDMNDLFKRPPSLNKPRLAVLEPHQSALFHAYHQIADIDSAVSEAPCLIIHSLRRGSVTWVYDRETPNPLRLTDNDLQKSRTNLAVRVMGETGTAEYADTLEALVCSDFDHFVRWEAAESVYKLDEQRGIELLRNVQVHDPNSSLARSARQTLANLTGEEVLLQ